MAGVPISEKRRTGFSLMEVVMAIVLLQLLIVPIFLIMSGLNHHFAKTYMHEEGLYWARRNLEAVTHVGQSNWDLLRVQPRDTELYLERQPSGQWQFKPGKHAESGTEYISWLVIEQACLKGDYQLVDCSQSGATPTDQMVVVKAYANWLYRNQLQEISLQTVITQIF